MLWSMCWQPLTDDEYLDGNGLAQGQYDAD